MNNRVELWPGEVKPGMLYTGSIFLKLEQFKEEHGIEQSTLVKLVNNNSFVPVFLFVEFSAIRDLLGENKTTSPYH